MREARKTMIVGEELRLWLGNHIRQRATQAKIDALGAQWNRGSVHQHFVATVANASPISAATIAEAFRAMFADDAWIDVLIGELANAMRDDPYFVPPFRALKNDIHAGLLVYEDAHVMVAAGVTRALELATHKQGKQGGSINFSGQITVLKFVHGGGAMLSFWEAPRIADDFTAAGAGSCRLVDRRRISDGEILVIDGRSQSYVVDHAGANLLLLQAAIKVDQAPLAVEYDAATGAYLGSSATDDADSRVQMIATLVRKLGHDGAFGAVATLLDHPRFFVRWHAMRELIGIDARAALPHLTAMTARDPHADVRAAAQATLERVRAGLGEKEAA
ncbi:MAG: HEAT repeat domain-containing protein [Sphingomonas sp.]|nr:HEAT repeat domain-containing protein [Sphingomonas sp.]